MKILMIYPESPETFYSFKSALKIINKRACDPPLGLITVAAMLPTDWILKLIDMNVDKLKTHHILWADYVFISGMDVHIKSFRKVVQMCNDLGVKVVAGGPLASCHYQDFPGIDHFVLNEAELTLPAFLEDLQAGCAKRIYQTEQFADITQTPLPRWDLIEMKRYASLDIQYSRGCPFDCEFCTITSMFGRKNRTKTKEQLLSEMNCLHQQGWRGDVFIVDDNFIGNSTKLKQEILPALHTWSKEHNYPFNFTTEASLNLADDAELMSMMADAGFNHVFVGIETPNEASLVECGKRQNRNRDLLSSVSKMQKKGLRVSAGFIVGFDSDPSNIFEKMIEFIQHSGIVTAMVGLLNAAPPSRLYNRLKAEKRLLNKATGNNTDGSINFIPKMDSNILINGYKQILQTIYSPRNYYLRLRKFLEDFEPGKTGKVPISGRNFLAALKSFWRIGCLGKEKRFFWNFFFHTLTHYPSKLGIGLTMAVYGIHFQKIAEMI